MSSANYETGGCTVELDIPARHGRIHCLIQGKGTPLLLLHGALGTGLTHFRRQVDVLAAAYRVIAPDLLGYGRSDRRTCTDGRLFDEHLYQHDAQDVVAMILHLNLPPVHLCGFSDGSTVAMILAADHPPLVRSLVLVGAQARLDEQTIREVRRSISLERLPPRFQEALARNHGDPYWRQMVTDYVEVQERIYRQGGDLVGGRLPRIRCPTLILHGDRDPYIGAEHVSMVHRSIPRAHLEVFPGVGHEVHREAAEAFNQYVLSFLSAVERTR